MTGVNIFGTRSNTSVSQIRGPPGVGFRYLDKDQNFDLNNRRLANISYPIEENDAASKIYVDELLGNSNLHLKNYVKTREDVIYENHESKLEALLTSLNEKISNLQSEINDEIQQNLDSSSNDVRVNNEKIEYLRESSLKKFEFIEEVIKNIKEEEIQNIQFEISSLTRVLNDLSSYVESFKTHMHQMDKEIITNTTEKEEIRSLLLGLSNSNTDQEERLKRLESTLRRETIETL